MTICSPRACEFKPEYTGKLNFYLSALDEYVKLPDENPSIGIILCKSKSDKDCGAVFPRHFQARHNIKGRIANVVYSPRHRQS